MESGFGPNLYQVDEVLRNKIGQLRVAELSILARQLGVPRNTSKQPLINNIIEKLKHLSSKYSRREVSETEIRRAFEAVEQQYQDRMHSGSGRRYAAPLSPGGVTYPHPTPATPPAMPVAPPTQHVSASQSYTVPQSHSGYSSQPASAPPPSASALNAFFPGKPSYSSSSSSSSGHGSGSSVPVPQRCYETFNDNPFHRWSRVVRSVKLVSLRDNHNKPFAIQFDLEKGFEKSYSVILYSFQLSTSSSPEHLHAWPTSLDVRINGRALAPTILKRASKKTKDEPFEMTQYLRSGSNTVELTSSVYTPFLMVINLHQRLSIGQLEATVLSRPMDYDTALARVRRTMGFGGGDDVQALASKISLIDPLMLVPVVHPCKASTCNHIQCFDLRTYLGMNERVSRWNCPICNRPALFTNLFIDPYVKRILQEVPPGVTEVSVEPDGSWTPPDGQMKIKREEPAKPAPVAASLSASVFDLNDSDGDGDYDDRDRPNGAANGHAPAPTVSICPRCSDRVPVGVACPTCAATQASAALMAPKACYVCKKTGKSMRCSQCKSVDYCGRDCQATDWPRHKLECFARAAAPPVVSPLMQPSSASLASAPRPAPSAVAPSDGGNPKLKQQRVAGEFGANGGSHSNGISFSAGAPVTGWRTSSSGSYASQAPRPPASQPVGRSADTAIVLDDD
eukprot:TRINITY_DN8248_c1_g1_i1.p1 TRINITY_DN8248_c1_g1~~TRINITY_DN8248_c1_g1_i1.p1  ORF type:complete len:680 (-),score=154.87 TRINITY_DN8248_c1_g1_i1:28-2067(-)